MKSGRKIKRILRNKKVWLIAVPLLLWFYFCLPDPLFNDPYTTVLEDRNGRLLSARIARDAQWRFPLSDSVPQKFGLAIRYFEDQYFDYHPGVNPVSLTRATYQNLRAGSVVSGGSTLSMQVIRLSRKGKARTVWEKFIEIILAVRLEFRYSKEEILALYAAHAPFGGNVVGLETASWRYYQRPAHLLSWGEAATLAVLPNAPALIFPGKNQELLRAKRNRLLIKLRNDEVIDPITCELALEEPLPGRPASMPARAPHLLDRAIHEGHEGNRLSTTLDLALQVRLNLMVDQWHGQLSQNEIHNMAILVTDNRKQEVLAYVGNSACDEEYSGRDVDIIRSGRSSGSILKPILYAGALEDGLVMRPTLVADVPIRIAGYAPKNFDKGYDGAVPADEALVRSLNIPAVRMLQQYGIEKFHQRLQDLNFQTVTRHPDHYGLSLILGGAEVTLWDVCRTYMGMANMINEFEEHNGRYRRDVFDNPAYVQREEIEVPDLTDKSMMNAGSVWQTLEVLTGLNRPETSGPWERFASSRKIAWKTGTSFGHKDAWAVGTTPEYTVGVWVGNADGEGRPGLTGLQSAAPLMFEVFSVLPASTWFSVPYDELEQVEICSRSGFRASLQCESVDTLWSCVNAVHVPNCTYHRVVHLDQSGQYRVNSSCYAVADMVEKNWFVLPPVMEWYYRKISPDYRSLPSFQQGCVQGEEKALDLIYPKWESKVFVPKNLEGQNERVVFEAAHHDPTAVIFWHLDDQFIGTTQYDHQLEHFPEPGKHVITLVDDKGHTLRRRFEVMEK